MSEITNGKRFGTSLRLTREEEADRDLRHTHVSRRVAGSLCAFFLATIMAVPVMQASVEIYRARSHKANGSSQTSGPVPHILGVFSILPDWSQVKKARSLPRMWALIPPVARIKEFENSLEQQSVLTAWLLPRTEALLTGILGAGNGEAIVGRKHWLFYRPDVEYVTGRPFLSSSVLMERRHSGGEGPAVQPDPVKAILLFKEQLARRGIQLVVMPAPVKPVIEPQYLSSRYSGSGVPIQNPSYQRFVQSIQSAGVVVYDPTRMLASMARQSPVYLRTDTHWTPPAMEAVAMGLTQFLRARKLVDGAKTENYVRRRVKMSNVGDIAEMLKLPQGHHLYSRQTVILNQVVTSDGSLWRSDYSSPILLLGDSFSNIYSLDGMGWGKSAGFAEQLSCDLQRPLDEIAVNAGGAYASRQRLIEDLSRGQDRLAGKKVVIYEFAMRDLASGDWKLLNLPGSALSPGKGTGPATYPKPNLSVPLLLAQAGPVIKSGSQSLTAVPARPSVEGKTSGVITGNTAQDSSSKGGSNVKHSGAGGPVNVVRPASVSDSAITHVSISADDERQVTGVVRSMAAPPQPGSVPYKDCIIGVRLEKVRTLNGHPVARDILVYEWGMKDNRWVGGASYRVGQTVTLTLLPWEVVESRYGGYNRMELDDPDALTLDAYWGEGK